MRTKARGYNQRHSAGHTQAGREEESSQESLIFLPSIISFLPHRKKSKHGERIMPIANNATVEIRKAVETKDEESAFVRRLFPTQDFNYVDPFFLFDEFFVD
jgi:hypothetical protein